MTKTVLFLNILVLASSLSGCSTVDKIKQGTREVASEASTVESSIYDIERAKDSVERMRNKVK